MIDSLLSSLIRKTPVVATVFGLVISAFRSHADAPTLVTPSASSIRAPARFGHSGAPALTANGRYVVFVSDLANLTLERPLGVPNIFLRDLATGTTTLVSVGIDGAQANRACVSPAVSEDGRFVLFLSRASNLTPDTANGWEQVYLRDLQEHRTELISANTNGLASAGPAAYARMTPDGRFVLFESPAADLAHDDTNHAVDVFWHDRASSETVIVSVSRQGPGSGNGPSHQAWASDDGRFVAFESYASDLTANDTNAESDVFVRDVEVGTTALVSVALSGEAAGLAKNPQISADGRYVAFECNAYETLLVGELSQDFWGPDIFLRDLEAGVTRHVSSVFNPDGHTNPRLSPDGRFVVFETKRRSIENLEKSALYVWSTDSPVPVLVTPALAGSQPASGLALDPVISDDGRYVTFISNSTNLVTEAATGTFQVYRRDLQTQTTRLVSVNLEGNGDNADCSGAATRDGNLIAFSSLEPNLTPDDHNTLRDVFVCDVTEETCERISIELAEVMSETPAGASAITLTPLNADGTRVAFTSAADNLVPNDTNSLSDVFVRDIVAGTLALVSVNTNAVSGNGASDNAVLSTDGRFVAFLSRATDLTPGGTNGVMQLYLRDLVEGTTTLVSKTADGSPSASPPANPSLSADGGLLAYECAEDGIAEPDSNGQPDVLVYDRIAGLSILASVNYQQSNGGAGPAFAARMAPGGTFVVFRTASRDLVETPPGRGERYYARNLSAKTTTCLHSSYIVLGNNGPIPPNAISADSTVMALDKLTGEGRSGFAVYDQGTGSIVGDLHPGNRPAVSATGRYVAYEGPDQQIWAWDRLHDAEILASINQDRAYGGNGQSFSPLLTPDGRFVIFASRASDLVPDDNNNSTDIFARDLLVGRTTLLSVGPSGAGGNRFSSHPVLGPDGHTLIFASAASDLASNDRNLATDLFLLTLGSPDSDGDSLDDDWEFTHFDDLSRNGTGDFDEDGISDRDEFLMGTDPRANSPRLLARTVTRLSDGQTTVTWDAVAGRSYQVQFLDDLATADWQSVPGAVTAAGPIGLCTDLPAGPHRFYRVLLVTP